MIMEQLLNSITDEMFLNLDSDKLLDSRDCDPFDSNWVQADNDIEKLKSEKGYSDIQKNENKDYCKKAFMKVCAVHTSCELAEYISDDFGLIYDSLQVGYTSPWLSKLINSYLEHKIPSGDL